MRFGNIYYLLLLLAIPPFLYFSLKSFRRSNEWLYSFAGKKKNLTAFLFHAVLICLIFACFSFSLSEPELQYKKTYFNRSNLEIVIGIDVSKSMLAEDVSIPAEGRTLFNVSNRLNCSRYFALDILSDLHGERIGSYMFASKAVEIIPFTRDYTYGRYILKHIKDSDITIPGSDLGEAVKTGISMLESSGFRGAKVMIIISDGEDISEDKSSLYESAKLAGIKGIKIYTVGTGTAREALIPIRDKEGYGIDSYYINEDGTYLKTSLTEDTLKYIADITGGKYFRSGDADTAELLMSAVLGEAKKMEETKNVELEWFALSPIFIFAGLLFLTASMLTEHLS